MDPKETLKNITELFVQLPDAIGLVRCAYFTDIYRMLRSLNEEIVNKEEEHKLEKLKLEEEIKDLKEMLASKGRE